MAESFQNEVPKARVNIKLDLHTGGASKKVELPLKLLVMGDYSNGQNTLALGERTKVSLHANKARIKRYAHCFSLYVGRVGRHRDNDKFREPFGNGFHQATPSNSASRSLNKTVSSSRCFASDT
jgi:hypothetical protein